MKLAAIHTSRVTALVEIIDLVPEGKVFLPDLLEAIAVRCDFRKYPKDFGKTEPTAGAIFEIGKWNDQPIGKMTIFTDGIVIETGSSTEDTETALHELLLWAKEDMGIKYEAAMIKRKVFYSQLAFYLDVKPEVMHPILGELAATLSDAASKQAGVPMMYRTSGIVLGPSTLIAKFPTGNFTIERRVDVPDSENKYFSGAPLRTPEHLALLEKFETALRK
jgi:hypothetical protein